MSAGSGSPIPPELVGFTVIAAIVAVAALVVALAAAIARRGRTPHPAVWTREPLEPWGSMVLVGLAVLPAVFALARAVALPALTPIAYLAAIVIVVDRSDQIGGLRWVSVDDEGVHWRTVRRGGTVPLREVTDVVGYRTAGTVPRVLLADGTALTLDRQPQARLVAAGIDQLSMRFRPGL